MKNYKGLILIIAMILIAISTRLLPHLPNFTAIGAIALFGSAYISKKYLALLIPLAAMWFSDLALNNIVYAQYNETFIWFQSFQIYTYTPILIMIIIGAFMYKTVTISKIIGGSILFPIIFFLISNFGTWLSPYSLFSHDLVGLINTYITGLPFLVNDLLGTFFYSTILFGAYYFITKKEPSLLLKNQKAAILSV